MYPCIRYRGLLCALALLGLAGCTAGLEDYQGSTPSFRLEQFFDGPLVAHGLVLDRSGRVTERFSVSMQGRWQGDQGVLDEQFRYADGRRERRVWRLEKQAEGRYLGRADDIVGEAQGQAAGFALNWHYRLDLRLKDGDRVKVDFDDWMYLLDEQRLINRAIIRKFGFRVGEVLLYIERQPPG